MTRMGQLERSCLFVERRPDLAHVGSKGPRAVSAMHGEWVQIHRLCDQESWRSGTFPSFSGEFRNQDGSRRARLFHGSRPANAYDSARRICRSSTRHPARRIGGGTPVSGEADAGNGSGRASRQGGVSARHELEWERRIGIDDSSGPAVAGPGSCPRPEPPRALAGALCPFPRRLEPGRYQVARRPA
jgi:hypothetical protein